MAFSTRSSFDALSGSVNEGHLLKKLGTFASISLIINKMIGTGIFLTPSIIFRYCNGNVTLYLFLWLLGGLITLCGLLVYLEFAMNLPVTNGGEKNYLLRVFPSPKGLAGCAYAFQMVLLGFSAGNSYAFGKYFLYAFVGDETELPSWQVKAVGVLCISFCTIINLLYPNHGTRFFNVLGFFKVIVLLFIIILGFASLIGLITISGNTEDKEIMHSSEIQGKGSRYYVSVALLEIIYSFKGWENANYVLSETEDPYHVLTIAAPIAVAGASFLYFLVILSYLIVIPREELMRSGVLVAGIFFNKIFGQGITSFFLPLMISLSNLGNVMVVSFAHSYVIEDLFKKNYLPFSRRLMKLQYALLLHWFVTVIVLVAPPSSEIYEFIINLYVYPGTWINICISGGLIYLKMNSKKEKWGQFNDFKFDTTPPTSEFLIDEDFVQNSLTSDDTFRTGYNSILFLKSTRIFSAPLICSMIFLFANIFLALFPFVPPPSGSVSRIPSWLFPVLGTSVLLLGPIWYYSRQYFYDQYYKGSDNLKRRVKYEDDFFIQK